MKRKAVESHLKSHISLYVSIWIVFVTILTVSLRSSSAIIIPIILAYACYYIAILYYESNRTIRFMKSQYNAIWLSINVSFRSNIYKWYKVLKKNDHVEGISEVKAHLNQLVTLHVLHFATLPIVIILYGLIYQRYGQQYCRQIQDRASTNKQYALISLRIKDNIKQHHWCAQGRESSSPGLGTYLESDIKTCFIWKDFNDEFDANLVGKVMQFVFKKKLSGHDFR